MLLRRVKNKKIEKEVKVTEYVGTIGSAGSVISSYNVCHSLCLATISLLSIIGITLNTFPFLFLLKYATIFWGIGVIFLAASLFLYFKYRKCISEKLIMFNAGLLTIGIPFPSLQAYTTLFWAIGGLVSLSMIGLYLKEKLVK